MRRLAIACIAFWIAIIACVMATRAEVIAEISTNNGMENAIEIAEAPPIEAEETAVYVPDSDDDCPVSDLVPLTVEVQEYIWTKCKKATEDYKEYYCFMLGSFQHESTFRASATHKNRDGSIDRGIGQINSSNIGKMKRAGLIDSTDDLFDVEKNINCAFYLMDQYIAKYGVSEDAYYAYNTGKEHGGSNPNSRIVMGYMSDWKKALFPEE